MIVTFILKGAVLSDVVRTHAMGPENAFRLLQYQSSRIKDQVSMRAGDGRGRANDEFIRMRKVGAVAKSMEFEDREGYVLARFTF